MKTYSLISPTILSSWHKSYHTSASLLSALLMLLCSALLFASQSAESGTFELDIDIDVQLEDGSDRSTTDSLSEKTNVFVIRKTISGADEVVEDHATIHELHESEELSEVLEELPEDVRNRIRTAILNSNRGDQTQQSAEGDDDNAQSEKFVWVSKESVDDQLTEGDGNSSDDERRIEIRIERDPHKHVDSDEDQQATPSKIARSKHQIKLRLDSSDVGAALRKGLDYLDQSDVGCIEEIIEELEKQGVLNKDSHVDGGTRFELELDGSCDSMSDNIDVNITKDEPAP